jgi:hypothetical protein
VVTAGDARVLLARTDGKVGANPGARSSREDDVDPEESA